MGSQAALANWRANQENPIIMPLTFAKMLVPGLEEAPGQSARAPVTIEAITGGIFDLCLHYAFQGRIGELPELTPSATYIALAPFLGSKDAARVATAATSTRLVW